MAVLDEDFCTDLMTPEGGDTLWSLPFLVPACDPLDWESLLEQAEARVKEERTRAAVADLRCEELRRSERDACSRARSLERQLDTCRFKLKAAVAEAKDTASAVSSAPEDRVAGREGVGAQGQIPGRRDRRPSRLVAQVSRAPRADRGAAPGRHQLAEAGHRPRTLGDCEGVPPGQPRGRIAAQAGRAPPRGGQAAGGSPGGHDRVAARTQ